MARNFGICTIDYTTQDVVSTIRSIKPEGADVVIDCVGGERGKTLTHKFERALNLETDSSEIFSEMFKCVKPFGHVSVIGVYVGEANHFPVGAMMQKGLALCGGQTPVQKYWKECLELVSSGKIDTDFLITHRGDLTRGPEFYKLFSERKDGVLKVLMKLSGEVEQEGK
eukprot:TRINITY_DN10691_c0_g1_i1.p1 TRINITY_DN10691_c0_g1~~TRINITY_DN10691_c0_g1_i1.p1  ORF type:complete len:169 (-),score=35.70 TRINITY_DN10691_c0_g1_i1:134-640(-)